MKNKIKKKSILNTILILVNVLVLVNKLSENNNMLIGNIAVLQA